MHSIIINQIQLNMKTIFFIIGLLSISLACFSQSDSTAIKSISEQLQDVGDAIMNVEPAFVINLGVFVIGLFIKRPKDWKKKKTQN